MRWFGPMRRDGELSCRQVGKVLQRFLDGELDGVTVEAVERHLEMCRRCGMELWTYHQIKAALARTGDRVPELALVRLRNFGAQLTGHDGVGGSPETP